MSMPSSHRSFVPRNRAPRGVRAADIPPQVPGYRLGPPVGFGRGGPVWSASRTSGADGDLGDQRVVAVLRFADGDRAAVQRRRLAALVGTRHEHLAEVKDVVELEDGCAVVSERLDGPTLAVLRVSRVPLELGEVVALLEPLAAALEHLHRHGVTHGDVSPANVVLTQQGRPVLVDLVGEVAFESGTTGFRAPERTAGAPARPAGDVWSLATTAIWLLAVGDRAHARSVLAPALAAAPVDRCSARELASLAGRLGERRSVTMPAAHSLAHGSLRARAVLEETRLAARRRPGSGRRTGSRPSATPRARGFSIGRTGHRAPRHRATPGPGKRWLAVGAVAVLALALGLDLRGLFGTGPAESVRPAATGALPVDVGPAGRLEVGTPVAGDRADTDTRADDQGEQAEDGPPGSGPSGAEAERPAASGQAAGPGPDGAGTGTGGGPAGEPAAAQAPVGGARAADAGPATPSPATARPPGGANVAPGDARRPPAAAPAQSGGTGQGGSERKPGGSLAGDVGRLVAARDAALNAGDGAALRALSVPGSPAARRDAPVAEALSTGTRVRGVSTSVRRVAVVDSAPGASRVAVVTSQSAHTRAGPGSAARAVPAQPERCSVLEVQPSARGLRVRDVAACPGGTG